MNLLVRIIISAVNAFGLAYVLPGIEIKDFFSAIATALVIALLNAFVKPVLVILTLPVTIFTLGLFLLVINAVIIMIADRFVEGFAVKNFWYALLFSVLLTIINSFIYGKIDKTKGRGGEEQMA
jgi:putative membrane protein